MVTRVPLGDYLHTPDISFWNPTLRADGGTRPFGTLGRSLAPNAGSAAPLLDAQVPAPLGDQPMMRSPFPFAAAAQPAAGPMLAQQSPQGGRELLAALLAQGNQGPSQGGGASPLAMGGMSMVDLAKALRDDKGSQGPLLGGAQAGAPDWLNSLSFRMSNAQGVNPWSYGMNARPGGTDTAGNYQV